MKIPMRMYGFCMAVFVPFLIGVGGLVCNEFWGSADTATAIAFMAFGLGCGQVFIEGSIEYPYSGSEHGYRAHQVVDFIILTSIFTALVSMVLAVWMKDPAGFLTILVALAAIAAGAWAHTGWIGKRQKMESLHPIHADFRFVIWMMPLATGALLLLNFGGHEVWGRSIFAAMSGYYLWLTIPLMHFGIPKKIKGSRPRQAPLAAPPLVRPTTLAVVSPINGRHH